MNLENKRISLVFLFTLIVALCFPVFFPSWRLMVFAPFLVILYYNKSFVACLWWSLICGLFLDLLSSHKYLGFFAVNYCITTALLFSQRRNFFADSWSTLPIMTFFFSSLSTLIHLFMMNFFEKQNAFSWSWAVTDLIYMPAWDAFYAFICFILPAICFGKRQRRGKDYFFESHPR